MPFQAHLCLNLILVTTITLQVAHVGHVVSRKVGGRDRGSNLMALPTHDNWTLGEKIVPCHMAAYWNRLKVACERLY